MHGIKRNNNLYKDKTECIVNVVTTISHLPHIWGINVWPVLASVTAEWITFTLGQYFAAKTDFCVFIFFSIFHLMHLGVLRPKEGHFWGKEFTSFHMQVSGFITRRKTSWNVKLAVLFFWFYFYIYQYLCEICKTLEMLQLWSQLQARLQLLHSQLIKELSAAGMAQKWPARAGTGKSSAGIKS